MLTLLLVIAIFLVALWALGLIGRRTMGGRMGSITRHALGRDLHSLLVVGDIPIIFWLLFAVFR